MQLLKETKKKLNWLLIFSFDPFRSQIYLAIFKAVFDDQVSIFNTLLKILNNDINIHLQNDESLHVAAAKNNSKGIILNIVENSDFDSIKSQINSAFAALLSNKKSVSIDMLIRY